MPSPDQSSGRRLTRQLGTLVARYTDENGKSQRVSLDLVVQLDPDDIERGSDGSIEFADLQFFARYPAHTFPALQHIAFYRDEQIETAINNYLDLLGHAAQVGFSEQGRQSSGELDFDADYKIIEELWPEAASAPVLVGP